ncbi:MAG: hypothetical protein IPP59_13950 [Betaproteobacteria bacterium]|nr:hypothetical protein [Candidatus Dechloromonas phosphorivorans]
MEMHDGQHDENASHKDFGFVVTVIGPFAANSARCLAAAQSTARSMARSGCPRDLPTLHLYSHTQIAINHADLNTVLNFLWAHTRNQNNRSSICIIWRDRSK